jgi:hypothetical protein
MPRISDDYPIDEMMAAAFRAKSKVAAVWDALEVLDRADGDLMLPLSEGDGSWRAGIGALHRRWLARERARRRKKRAQPDAAHQAAEGR